MIWSDLPNWKLTWSDNSIILKVDRSKRMPSSTLIHHTDDVSFEVLKINNKIVGYKFSLYTAFKCFDEGWYVCVYFDEPQLLESEPIYEDKNVRLLKVGKNYTFALRWKQSS